MSQQLRRAGITMRRGAPAHPASTQHIVELHDQGLTWNEVANQVDMTVSVPGAATDGPGRQSRHAWAVGSKCSPTRLTRISRLAYGPPSLIISAEPPPELNSMLLDEPPTVWRLSVVPACTMCRAPMPTTMRATATI